jgi:CheY-like chemotaxis protein
MTIDLCTAPKKAGNLLNDLTAAPHWRILVADDDADTADSMTLLLRLLGHTVISTYSGLGTLATAATFLPQIVFLDIGMPEMNGYDVARQLRAMPEIATVVLVALTGYGRDEDRRRAKEAGFDFHFLKPTTLTTIEQFLAGLPSRHAGAIPLTSGKPQGSTRIEGTISSVRG